MAVRAHSQLENKMREAAREAASAGNMSKDHILVSYSFKGKAGSRVLRLEGVNEFDGKSMYYDYRTKKTKTLDEFLKFWGVSGITATHSIELSSLKATPVQPEQQGSPTPVQQNETPSQPAQSGGNPAPAPSQEQTPPSHPNPPPTQQRQHAPISRPPSQRSAQPKPPEEELNLPLGELKAPQEPPQGKIGKKIVHTALIDLLSKNTPFFGEYLQRYYSDGPMRCASGAWGLILPYMLAEEGKAAAIFPVSTWKLKGYVKKSGVSPLITERKVNIVSNLDLHNILSDEKNDLPRGTVITLDSGHPYDGKRRGDPSHTLVYDKSGKWYDNRTNLHITSNYFSGKAASTGEQLSKSVEEDLHLKLSQEELQSLEKEGSWLKKGKAFIARENGEFVFYRSNSYMSFAHVGAMGAKPGKAISKQALASAIGDKSAIISDADASKVSALEDGECHFIQVEASKFVLSSRDANASSKAIAMFGTDIFSSMAGQNEMGITGTDGKKYVVRREFDETGKREALNAYLAPTNKIYYILQRKAGSIEISAKKNDFLEWFTWASNSGLYEVNFSKMPPSVERTISSKDFGLEKVTAEGFAVLLSKTYGIMFEYALNEILRQNNVPTPRAYVGSLDVQLSVMLPGARIGRIRDIAMDQTMTPAEKDYFESMKRAGPMTTTSGAPIPSVVNENL